jgi:Protein of unknown function (DUF2892)
VGATLMKPSMVNLTLFERVARAVIGTAGVAGAVAWFALVPSLLVAAGALALAVAGLDLVVTGARGYCPLYAWIGRRHTRRTSRA